VSAVPPRHAALALTVAVVWGVNFVVIDVGLDRMPPLLFAALRFAAVALLGVAFVGRPRIGWKWVLAIGTFLSAGQFGPLFVALDNGLPAGLASLLIQLQALFTIALAVLFLGERLKPAQVAGAGVALLGLAVIATGRAETVPLGAVMLCVCAALSWGVGNVLTRMAQAPDAKALLVWSSFVPPLPLAALSFALEEPSSLTLDAAAVLSLAFVVVVSTGFGFGVWAWLLGRHSASRVAPFALLVPVVGMASGWVALGERPNAAEWAGAALVLVGLVVTVAAVTRRRRGFREASDLVHKP
jgi:O-acetylserine/cysteine efflux transporter